MAGGQLLLTCGFCLVWLAAPGTLSADLPAVVLSETLHADSRIEANYSSTLAATPAGLLVAWVGASRPGAVDASVWLSRHDGTAWSKPVEIANGTDSKRGRRIPCWKPVLFRRFNGDVLLFYKTGIDTKSWRGFVRLSRDEGRTWSRVTRLNRGCIGPLRVKPVEMLDGMLICGAGTYDRGWRVHVERTYDPLRDWEKTGPLNRVMQFATTDPALLYRERSHVQILSPTKQGCLVGAQSLDGGLIWSEFTRLEIPNPGSGIDVEKLDDERFVLVYNHSATHRNVLNLAVSSNGTAWRGAGVLEMAPDQEFVDPAIVETEDELLHVTYTVDHRRIKHVVLDPAKLEGASGETVP